MVVGVVAFLYQSRRGEFEVVLGKVLEIGRTHPVSSYYVNCLENSIDSNCSVTFAVNAIDSDGCRSAWGDNLYQDATSLPDS